VRRSLELCSRLMALWCFINLVLLLLLILLLLVLLTAEDKKEHTKKTTQLITTQEAKNNKICHELMPLTSLGQKTKKYTYATARKQKWQIQKFCEKSAKGGRAKDDVSATGSFIATAHNKLYAFYMGKRRLTGKISEAWHPPLPGIPV